MPTGWCSRRSRGARGHDAPSRLDVLPTSGSTWVESELRSGRYSSHPSRRFTPRSSHALVGRVQPGTATTAPAVASSFVPEFQTSPGMRDLLAPDSVRNRQLIDVFAGVVEPAGY